MKKSVSLLCSVLILISLFGCAKQSPSPTPTPSPAPASASPSASPALQALTVGDYFPIRKNVRYVYQGQGNEFASYNVYIDYTSDTKVQQRINNSGSELVRVIEVADGKATCIFSREECYYRENFLDRTGEKNEVLLMEPVKTGTSWTLGDGSVRTITNTNVGVDTPSGAYTAIAVETAYKDGGKTTDYYAQGVGLIKTVSTGESYEFSSSLSEIQQDAAFKQTVRFYYPNINDNKPYYKDRELTFNTNDITRNILEKAYKEQFEGQPAKVLSEGTKVNSLYLNDDGMVYLDLSKEFVTEMNAGSGYESMILQCVANTFGSYYGVDKVILTIDGKLYESGHIKLEKGQYLTVKTDGSAALT